jgi:hypothetical protein
MGDSWGCCFDSQRESDSWRGCFDSRQRETLFGLGSCSVQTRLLNETDASHDLMIGLDANFGVRIAFHRLRTEGDESYAGDELNKRSRPLQIDLVRRAKHNDILTETCHEMMHVTKGLTFRRLREVDIAGNP